MHTFLFQLRRRVFPVLGAMLFCAHATALTEVTNVLFSGSGNCAFCHEQWSGALLDSKGNNVSITGDWRATMMAHSFNDPLWRARMEAEVADRPDLKEFIEDKCLTCHAPMARTLYRHENGEPLSMDAAKNMELAHDGVSCTLCHQIQAENLSEESSFDGGYAIGADRQIHGPYTNVVTMPMRNHVDYTPGFGAHVQDSAFCATCHTLFTPVLDEKGKEIGLFPEQVPYLEWKNSVYPGRNKHCQDCHMPRLDEPIQITARPPWIGTQEPFWRHTFFGANTFMLQLLANPDNPLCTLAESEAYQRQIDQTRIFLREETARLSVASEVGKEGLLLRVNVENLTGHKLPTGYPHRRAWLRVEVCDAERNVIFVSGDYDEKGRLKSDPPSAFLPHHQHIQSADQVQVYEAVMGDLDGQPTAYLLRAARYLKDNRIPPKGFSSDGPFSERTAVRGMAVDDPAYANGSGADTVKYTIPLQDAPAPYSVCVELLYQTVPPASVAEILQADRPAAKAFSQLYQAADKKPEVLCSMELSVPSAAATDVAGLSGIVEKPKVAH